MKPRKIKSQSLQKLFEDFQGRSLKKCPEIDIDAKLPRKVFQFGFAEHVMYFCDKRDPGDPYGEGAQGHWKHFIHKHGAGVELYQGVSKEDAETDLANSWCPIYPNSAAWLGELTEIKYKTMDGEEDTLSFKGMNLWVWDDERTLMALPKNLKGKIPPEDVILFTGGRLIVTRRGIEH